MRIGSARSQTRYCAAEGERVDKSRILPWDAVEELDPPEWLIEGVIPKGALIVVYGEPSAGKTFIAISMAMSIATAVPWADLKVKKGPAVYVAGEGLIDLGTRKAAWMKLHRPREKPEGGLLPEAVNLLEPTSVDRLLEELMAVMPSVVIIDTLARAMVGGDENSARDMGRLVDHAEQIVKQIGATVILIHHTGKFGTSERGSSALRGAADAMIQVEQGAELGHSKGVALNLTCEKMRLGKEFKPFKVVLTPILVEIKQTSVPCAAVGGQIALLDLPTDAYAPRSDEALQVLRQQFPNGATWTAWMKATKLKKSTFVRAVAELEDSGRIGGGKGQGSKYYAKAGPTETGSSSTPKGGGPAGTGFGAETSSNETGLEPVGTGTNQTDIAQSGATSDGN
jgi:hypothetical protein